MKLRSTTQEGLVGVLLVAGFLVSAISLGFGWMFGVAGVYRGTYTRDTLHNDKITDAGAMNLLPVTLVFLVIGLLMFAGGLALGFGVISCHKKGPQKQIDYFRILARFATSRSGALLSDWELENADRPRFYVRATYPNAHVEEYEVAPEMYLQCGEGMVGQAEIQGRWIGRFTPYIGEPIS